MPTGRSDYLQQGTMYQLKHLGYGHGRDKMQLALKEKGTWNTPDLATFL